MMTSLCVNSYERTEHLIKTLQSIAQFARQPYEVIIVDDCSKNPEVLKLLEHFQRQFASIGVTCKIHVQEKNGGHAASNNKAWSMSEGDFIFHIEDDICVNQEGYNLIMAKFLQEHPEVGQVCPEGTGRGEWIPRESATGNYREFAWALGGFFAIRREVFDKIGGWDANLVHQVEPDFNLRVRMEGWRLAEVPGVRMEHLGEGEQHETFKRQAQIVVGVHQMLGKWNKRFVGFWDYDSLWSMSWDDFPPNAMFRRQLASWFASQARKLEDRYRGLGALKDDPNYANAVPAEIREAHAQFSRCELNEKAEPFKYPAHWGSYELVKVIRPGGREREKELITLMKSNHVFGNVRRIENQLRDLAIRMNYALSEEELAQIASKVPMNYKWEGVA